jgi:all-trans-retinol 13,14-reductase
MLPFDVVVIGGGLGGLSAGAILARQGKSVLLLEQHYIPGGCATTFKRKDFIMEAGLHAMDGHLISTESERSILRSLGVRKSVSFVPIPEFYHITGTGFEFTFPNGTERAVESLVRAFPGEKAGIRKFFRIMMGVQQEISRFPGKTWKQVLLLPFFPFLFPNIMKTFRISVGKCLDSCIRNERLKLILQGNILYYHDDPYSMSMVFFAKAQASFIQHGSYFIWGGSQKLSNALAAVIEAGGGTVLLGKKVTRILIEKGRAVGVSFRDTFNEDEAPREIRARNIIHSGAVPLVKDLLPQKEKARIARRIDHMKPACSLFCVYLGFRTDLSGIKGPHYSTFLIGNDVQSLGDVQRNFHGDWKLKSFVFVDYSRVDSGLAPLGKSFGAICTADSLEEYEGLDEGTYQRKKEEIARILVDRLETAMPGIRELIEYYEISTPRTIRRYTLNPYGAPYGFAQIRGQVGNRRPAYRSPVKNLWFSGTWTFPGGGFTGAIISGFLCGLRVAGKSGRARPAAAGEVLRDPRSVHLVNKEEVARETLELSFSKPEGYRYEPGQFAVVRLDHPVFTDLDMPFRTFSMVSHPEEALLKFVMRLSGSSFKKSCVAMEPGDTATIYGPDGHFTLRDQQEGMVFLSSGIGISPVIPLLKELEKRKYGKPVFVISSNRSEADAAYHDHLRSVRLEHYRYIPVFTAEQDRIGKHLLEQCPGELKRYEYYLSGGRSFIRTMTGILGDARVGADQIIADDFG